MTQRRTVHFSGDVQGVGFRATTCRLAAGLDVAGYVRNLPDGRVELIAEGTAAETNRLVQQLNDHFGSMIDETAEAISAATEEFNGFQLRH